MTERSAAGKVPEGAYAVATVTIRPKFDRSKETRPRFQFRTTRSHTPKRVMWEPRDLSSDAWKIDRIELPVHDGIIFVDLFAYTTSTLSPNVSLPCRRFLATAIVTEWDTWVSSVDMVDDHVKFEIKIAHGHGHCVGQSPGHCVGQSPALVDKASGLRSGLIGRVFEMCRASNANFSQVWQPAYAVAQWLDQIRWIHGGIKTFNTSYVDAICCPIAPAKRPVPGWINAMHLQTATPATLAFYRHSFELACRRMAIDPATLSKAPKELQVEVLCDAAAWVGRRCVYVHDTVLLNSGTCADVDHYGFPQLVDDLCAAGDDCESTTLQVSARLRVPYAVGLQTMLFLIGFASHTRPSRDDWLSVLHDVVHRYQIYQVGHCVGHLLKHAPQVTGGIKSGQQRHVPQDEKDRNVLLKRSYGGARATPALDGKSNTSSAFSDCQRVCCHSWLMLVPKETNELWVRRGRQWIMSVKDPSKVTCAKEACQDAKDADWPVVFVESTEYTTSVSIVFEDEREHVDFCTKWATFKAAEAFRHKVPWSMLQKLDRYVYVTTAVAVYPCSQCKAREFVVGSIVPINTSQRGGMGGGSPPMQGGVSAQSLFDPAARLASGTIALFPSFTPKDADLDDAKQLLEWFPPIFPIPFPGESTLSSFRTTPRGVFRVYCRPEEWKRFEGDLADWIKKQTTLASYEAREYVEWQGCTGIEIDLGTA